MRTSRLGVLTFVLTISIGTNNAGAAPPDEVCKINEETRTLDCITDHDHPGITPVGTNGTQGNSTTPTAVWQKDQLTGYDRFSSTRVCTTTDGLIGTEWRYRLVDLATGQVLRTVIQCDPLEAASGPAAAPPPAPPTIEELLDSAPIPEPVILSNPSGRGLTGLESWFWAADPGVVTAQVELRGWNVTGTLTAQQWTWTTGDGGRYEASSPGSTNNPAARHVYETKDTWPVTLQVGWSGAFTVSGFGTTYTVTGLATTGTSALDYDVIEVRGVVDEPQPTG